MKKCIPITVVIPTLNEENNLEKCLSKLEKVGEIVVVDSGSTDKTVEIAKQYSATVKNFIWDGNYPKKRNWYLLNFEPKHDWVFFLDADEIVDDRFLSEVEKNIGETTHRAFQLNYDINFRNKKHKFGIRQRKVALVKFGFGFYEKIEEDSWSSLDMEIHEHPIIDGTIGTIKSPIDHIDRNDIAKFYQRHINYAMWEVERYSKISASSYLKFSFRQKIKYKLLPTPWFSAFYFILDYFVFLRLLDGWSGLKYSKLKKWYFTLIRELLIEQRSSN